MGALVFVTSELSPFTNGGIGRVIHNILKTMSASDRQRTHVALLDSEIGKAEFSAVFPSVRLMRCDTKNESGRFEANGHHPPASAYSGSHGSHWQSSVVFRALKTLAQSFEIEYVEFPDWRALGFATIQEKKISGFLGDACLAVRLHSTHALLMQQQAFVIKSDDLYIADLERKSLRDCDRIVGQLAPVAEATRCALGLESDEWDPRLVLHAPPVLLDTTPPVASAPIPSSTTQILFGSKFDPVKRPDLFIRGVNVFCNSRQDYRGDISFSAHSFNAGYRDSILKLVPAASANRFNFDAPRHSVAREPVIAKSVFVVPSDFESFCLAAYEASLLGATVVLNGLNPAFGDGTPWQDGLNCIKFDGTALGLAKALERSFAPAKGLDAVTIPDCSWPWEKTGPQKTGVTIAGDQAPLVTVVVSHFNLALYLPETLNSILEQTYSNLEVIIVDDHSTDISSRDLIENLNRNSRARFKVIKAPASLGLAAARNLGVAAAEGKYLLPLDAGDLLDRRFIEIAVGALESNTEFDVVVPQAGYFREDGPPPLPGEFRNFDSYAIFVGEAHLCGFQENRFSAATAFFRTSILQENHYRESLNCYVDWNLYLRIAQLAHRFLVTTGVYVAYRNHENSMVKTAHDPWSHSLFLHDMLRTSVSVRRMIPAAYTGLAQHHSPPEPGAATKDITKEVRLFGRSAQEWRGPLISVARAQMVKYKIKRFLTYPVAKYRRRYRSKIRAWKGIMQEVRSAK
jgi:glycosyltransferase involved in cell wall biosynthesis